MQTDGVSARLPSRSHKQRLRALEQAKEVRSARAQLKKELASGKIGLAQILAKPPACVLTRAGAYAALGAAEDWVGQGGPDPWSVSDRALEDGWRLE